MPGDDSTFTIITTGTHLGHPSPWAGPRSSVSVGTLVEPPEEDATFTGQVVRRRRTVTRYEDEPLESSLPEEDFFEYACRAATGT